MTPSEIREIAREGDPETMAEALFQIADERGPADRVYATMVEAWKLSPLQADLLHILWRYKGELVVWERLMGHMGCNTQYEVQQGALRHLRPKLSRMNAPVRITTVYGMGLKLTQTGPVPWETGH